MTLADGLAIGRALAVIPIVVLIAVHSDAPALLLFAAASLSDAIDGTIARSRDEVTDHGGWLDPLADKVLVSGVIAALAARALIPTWIVLVVVAREALAVIARGRSRVPLLATADGKAKTVLQFCAIGLVLFAAAVGSAEAARAADVVLGTAVALTAASGLRLIARASKAAAEHR